MPRDGAGVNENERRSAKLPANRRRGFSAPPRFSPLFPPGAIDATLSLMPIVRILVDGYSLLHEWLDLAPSAARHTATAREALIQVLTQYQDATHTPISVFFDGQGAPPGTPKPTATGGLEVIYSGPGKTADDLIERVAYRLKDWGEVLVISNDRAERDTVTGFGGLASDCTTFIAQVRWVLRDLEEDLRVHNRREAQRFRSGGR